MYFLRKSFHFKLRKRNFCPKHYFILIKMQNLIKLQTNSVLQVPFQNYEKDFTFIVNSAKFETSIFQADLLSSTISKIHSTDPTVKEFFINTENSGDFDHILKLLNFNEEIISEDEIPFIIEIIEILGIKTNLKIQNNINDEINISNILFRIRNNQKHPQLLSKQLERDIEFFASHFNEIKDELLKQIEEKHFEIEEFVIENILNDPKLQLNNEDELLDFVNKLYKHDSKYSELYKYVDFNNVESSSIKEFVDIFDFNDMTHSVWLSITKSLQQKTNQEKPSAKIQEINFDFTKHEDFLTEFEQINEEIEPINKEFEPNEDEFDGILNYLQTHSNIKNEIIIYSSSNRNYTDPYEIVNYASASSSSYILTRDKPNSWICIEFINHRIIPSGYMIESCTYDISETLRSWAIEGSNDNQYWETLDTQANNDSLNGVGLFHLFAVSNYKYNTESFKYLRIRQTGSNWCENDSLFIASIEFYGKII